ncbi:sigma 54-interacting transcriptional regulator [Clostridium sp.]|uniref:sigma-54-dependent transcriptional regulator n=1 Tax=Clostridium sp. TaxID=1506 RepID=UPI00290E055F|nr:sigma 54-interacting transcriptional regulator [Clostridium sp.]MDU5107304.1 sigma 54-interacting transcriptional regulator [Clostridium sp.]
MSRDENDKEFNRKEKIYLCLKDLTKLINSESDIIGYDSMYLSNFLNIHRTGVSRELNSLVRENRIIKVMGKPVLYLDKKTIEKNYKIKLNNNIFLNVNSLRKYLEKNNFIQSNIKEEKINNNSKNIDLNRVINNRDIIFNNIIGCDDSLKNQINQAKAAILYPPNGLHTLILGSTGVGKTTFAEKMYKYAIEVGTLKQNAPYILFNCADYSGNPQLLLSHLFGYVKGAFTGADKEKKGIVDSANGGILFLDEVHRLPSEGQEMLFSLIDRGNYRRLGETENNHKANVLIIAATTEDVNKSILKTFLRRIPCVINLPSLADRSINERLKLIIEFFTTEAKKINLPLTISAEVIKLLLIYDCPGNIGQLKNDIKLISANSFAETVINNGNHVFIDLPQISSRLKDIICTLDNKRDDLNSIFVINAIREVTINGNEEEKDNKLEHILLDSNYRTEGDFYENILKKSREYFFEGKPVELIKNEIDLEIEKYFSKNLNGKKNKYTEGNEEVLSKIVSKDILDSIEEIFEEYKEYLEFEVDKKIVYSLALHVETLIGKLKSGIQKYKMDVKTDEKSNEFIISQRIKDILEERLNIVIPNEEAIIISMFLSAVKETKKEDYIGILVIAHGESTATSMVNVANKLLGVTHAQAIDMPLEESVQSTYDKVLKKVKGMDNGRGVLLLVDMGSLATFSQMITNTTGIVTGVIKMVSTPMVIEATRKAMMPNVNLKSLIKEVNSMSQYIGKSVSSSQDEIELNKDILKDNYYNSFLSVNEDKFLDILDQTATFLNTKKAYELLNEVLNNITAKLNIIHNDGLTVKFLFHCISMLERVIKNGALEYKNFRKVKNDKIELFKIVKEGFQLIENTFGITIPDSELTYIVELFDIHMEEVR